MYRVRPPETQWALDLMASIKRGDVDQSSFGFQTVRDEWQYDRESKETTRTLLEVKLFDVSPVTFPAYPQTSVSARVLDGAGVSVAEFADAYARARAGSLDGSARSVLDSVTRVLASFPVAPAEQGHPTGGPGAAAVVDAQRVSDRLALLTRRLDLALL